MSARNWEYTAMLRDYLSGGEYVGKWDDLSVSDKQFSLWFLRTIEGM